MDKVEQAREWTLWCEQRPPNAPGSYRYRASFPLLGLPVTAEWEEEMRLCGMGYGDSEWWPLRPCYWNGYRRYMTIENLEWSPVAAYDPEGVVWHGLELLPCPFSGLPPKVEVSGSSIGAPLWRSEAVWLSSPGVPKRRWTDAKAMQKSWNARATPSPDLMGEMVEALKRIAAYDDEGASRNLKLTGSYCKFDEPRSVEIARDALAAFEREKSS